MSRLAINARLQRGSFELSLAETLDLDGVTAVFGPSGAGKSSLLRLIAGLEREAIGEVTFDSTPWQSEATWMPAHLRGVGFVFQDTRLFAHLSVADNCRFPLRRLRSRALIGFEEVVDALELTSLLERRTHELSGGERQRVAIGRSLLASPRLLLMDEPLSSLDRARKRELIPFIERLPSRFGLPILYVTHDADEVTRLARRMLVLTEGQVVDRGTPAEVFARLDYEDTEGARDAGAVLSGEVLGQTSGMTEVSIDGQVLRVPRMELAAGSKIHFRIRARDVVIAASEPTKLSIRNVLEASINEIELHGQTHADLTLSVGSQILKARITGDAVTDLGLRAGQRVYALVKTIALDTFL